jgi:hypothetical protein
MQNSDLQKAMDMAILEALRNLHTIVLGKIETVKDKTIDVLPVINRVVDGESIQLPLFLDVPPVFLQGGGSYLAHPLAKGDYCLLLVSERCFDDWYHGGDFRPPLEFRLHDYSDCFALVGINPLASAISIPDTATHQGDLNLNGDLVVDGNITTTGNITAGGNLAVNGDATVSGSTTVDSLSVNDLTVGGDFNFSFESLDVNGDISATSISATGDITATGNITAGFGGGNPVSLLNHVHNHSDSWAISPNPTNSGYDP